MTFTERLAAALQCFVGAEGAVRLDIRDQSGFSHEQNTLNASEPLPFWLLGRLRDAKSVRVAPVTTAGQLPILFCLWRPAVECRRHFEVVPEAKAAITDALRTMPRPSILVSAGPEIWAAWRLPNAVSVAAGRTVLDSLARRLAGDLAILTDLNAVTLPLAGPVRNWNNSDPAFADILEANPELRVPFPSDSADSLTTLNLETSHGHVDRHTASRANRNNRTRHQRTATA